MSKFIKVTFAAAAIVASASSFAAFSSAEAVEQGCQSHSFTTHGIWDCR